MNILVTGGSGFIGRNIVRLLKDEGNTVTTLDIKDKNSISDYHIKADVRSLDKVKNACKGMEYVLHLAAITSPPEFENLSGEGYEVNVLGTYNVLAASAMRDVKRVIVASSSSLYRQLNLPAKEEDASDTFSNFYPASKKIDEITAKVFLNYGLETLSLRYFNTYGLGEDSKGNYSSIIWKFIDDVRKGNRPVIYGNGTQSRDFIYVKDTARASILAMKSGKPGESYNVGTGRSIDFNNAFKIISEELGFTGNPIYIQNPLRSYQQYTQADMTKTGSQLGFLPKFDLGQGLKDMLNSLEQNR